MCRMEILPPDIVTFALSSMSSSRGIQQFQISTPTPSSSLEFPACQKLLRQLYRNPSISLHQVERIRAHLHRLFVLRTTDNTDYLLKCPPTRDTRLLRHEYKNLETENRILELVAANSHVPVPRTLSFDATTNNNIRSPHLLRSYVSGTSLTDMLPYLSALERAGIDRSLGTYLHSLTRIRLGSFGSTPRVFASQGCESWSEAFRTLLESALRDAEDVLVNLPYDAIRYYAAAHRHVLDEITEPALCPLDAGKPAKVILDERRRCVVGLLGFSNVVWGDPQLAGVFATASEAFWEGYGGRPENTLGFRIRYYVYRSVVMVATQYQRPTADGEDFEARRTLTWALGQLAGLGENVAMR